MARLKVSFTIGTDRSRDLRQVNREAEVEQLRQGRRRPRAQTFQPKKGGGYNRQRDNVIPLRRRDID